MKCARHVLAVGIALLALSAPGHADDLGAVADIPIATAMPATSERGLQPRIRLAPKVERLYAPCPTKAAELPPEEPVAADERQLTDHLALNLNPTTLGSPNEAGQRHGHGNVFLSVPLNDALDLRTGVRVDYDSRPESQEFAAEATPTIGVGFEF